MDLPIKIDLPEGFLDEEVRCGYTVSGKMKAVWAVELDLLSELQRVCKRHNIIYYACAGTMLGAVRHKGIIPWDDDIDVMMLRMDYDLLCDHSDEFNHPYFFQTENTDSGSMRGHAQLRNSLTTGILGFDRQGDYSFNQGIFIDIFPLDNLPDNESDQRRFLNSMIRRKNLIRRIRDIPTHPNASSSRLKNTLRHIISPGLALVDHRHYLSHILFMRYEKQMKRYINFPAKTVGIITLADLGSERFQWNKEDIINGTIVVPFEFMNITLPAGYINMLKKTFGDWEKPVKTSSGHGNNIIFNPFKSYVEYLKENHNESTYS